jgi:hypothetical protein
VSAKRARLVKWAKRVWPTLKNLNAKCNFARAHNLNNWKYERLPQWAVEIRRQIETEAR